MNFLSAWKIGIIALLKKAHTAHELLESWILHYTLENLFHFYASFIYRFNIFKCDVEGIAMSSMYTMR